MSKRPIDVQTVAILAGGRSRRMFPAAVENEAGDKALLMLGPETMVERIIRRMKPQAANIVLNTNSATLSRAAHNLPVVADQITGFVGPLAGILAGMQWAKTNDPGATHIVTVSADVPFVPRDLVSRLVERAAASPDAIVLATSGGRQHPVIGCWPLSHFDDLAACLTRGDRKVVAWADRHGIVTVDFDPIPIGAATVDPFFNANTPTEFEDACRLIRAEAEST